MGDEYLHIDPNDPLRKFIDNHTQAIQKVEEYLKLDKKQASGWSQWAPVLLSILIMIGTFVGIWQVSLYKIDALMAEKKELQLRIANLEVSYQSHIVESNKDHYVIYENSDEIEQLEKYVNYLRDNYILKNHNTN